MAVKLVWTRRAIQGYDRIIKYLEEKWSEKEVKNFVSETVHFFDPASARLQRVRQR